MSYFWQSILVADFRSNRKALRKNPRRQHFCLASFGFFVCCGYKINNVNRQVYASILLLRTMSCFKRRGAQGSIKTKYRIDLENRFSDRAQYQRRKKSSTNETLTKTVCNSSRSEKKSSEVFFQDSSLAIFVQVCDLFASENKLEEKTINSLGFSIYRAP